MNPLSVCDHVIGIQYNPQGKPYWFLVPNDMPFAETIKVGSYVTIEAYDYENGTRQRLPRDVEVVSVTPTASQRKIARTPILSVLHTSKETAVNIDARIENLKETIRENKALLKELKKERAKANLNEAVEAHEAALRAKEAQDWYESLGKDSKAVEEAYKAAVAAGVFEVSK